MEAWGDSAGEQRLRRGVAAQVTGGMSLRRARATWLRAHVVAGTPLAALRGVAGPLSMNTLSTVVDKVAGELDASAAAVEALRA